MKRKGLAIILAFCLVISLVPVLASAATTAVTKLTLPDKILLSTNSRFSVNVPVEKEPSDANQQISWNIKDEDYVEDLLNNNFDKVINNEDMNIIR